MYKKYKKVGIIAIGALLVAGLFISYITGGKRELGGSNYDDIFIEEDDSEIKPVVSLKEDRIIVDIKGMVKSPGVYELDQGSIIRDLIEKAGGLKEGAYTDNINLAQELENHQCIKVHSKKDVKNKEVSIEPEENSIGVTGNQSNYQSGKININKASITELDSLPSIGPTIAQNIIDYRETKGEFKSIEEIKGVNRIGDGIFDKIKDLITVS